MSNNDSSRLDRLEALAENILAGLQETKERLKETREGLQETREGLQETREGLQETREGLQEAREGLQEARKGIQETREGLQEIKAITFSNARSIEALTNNFTERKSEWEKDRRGLYQLLGQLTRSMSDFYAVQSDFYNRFDQIDARQARMTEILNRYLPPDTEQN